MSRIVHREVIEEDRDVVVDDRPFYTSPLAIALGVLAAIVLAFILIAGPLTGDNSTGTQQPTNNTAPANEDRETGGGAGGDQTGGGTDAPSGGTDTGNGGNTNSGADGGATGTP